MTAAANLVEVTKQEADSITSDLDAREKQDLNTAYGVGASAAAVRATTPRRWRPWRRARRPAPSGACSTWSTAA